MSLFHCFERENTNNIDNTVQKVKIAEIRKMSVLDIIEHVVKLTEDKPMTIHGAPSKYLKVLAERLNISTIQALLLSVFVSRCDDREINNRDLARHFDGSMISILKCIDDIEQLVKLGIIHRNLSYGRYTYHVPQNVLENLCKNRLPEPKKIKNLTAFEWLDTVESLLENMRYEDEHNDEFAATIQELINSNLSLNCVQAIKACELDSDELKLFMIISILAINNGDDRICGSDLDQYYKRTTLRTLVYDLHDGNHVLFEKNLIEHGSANGMVEPSIWKLTDYSKNEIYSEFRFKKSKTNSRLLEPEKIIEKRLFYNDNTTMQINELRNILDHDRMNAIMNKLESKGMRRGFACLFYGSPGTGKTETVLQLAKATGRSILQVNISTIRSKWVGETEDNIKACFDTYRKTVKECEIAPILFFNEADALLTKRNENAEHCADKMENAMQNIILQELETLDGILIATTNLQGSLDDAFERRFLYKIEFPHPTSAERSHIWKAMLPELTHEEALQIAESFDFSGGQIENIARKCTIGNILANSDELDKEALLEYCRHESLTKENTTHRIGFVA